MLDATFLQRFNALLAADISAREHELRDALMGLKRLFASRGTYNSGSYAAGVRDALEGELQARTQTAIDCLRRVQNTLRIPADAGFRDDAKNLLREKIGLWSGSFSADFQAATSHLSWRMDHDFSRIRQQMEHRASIEVDLLADASAAPAAADSAANSFHFYGPVGALQTGSHARAKIVQNLGDREVEALRQVLEQIRDRLQSSDEVDPTTRTELIQLADDCEGEITSSAPNVSKLNALFQYLATTVQTLASTRPAYDALRAALIPLGIHLP